ncbi:enoyl-CoA hydratase/isomerase family protein [Phaeospirillum tilakii]|uniref:Enoyl-CoA hydratase/isomerase family protein n=1 Tax=Phaeospirillum tilakii TaxID=741673 RepID=A0ABW5C802_9PROT
MTEPVVLTRSENRVFIITLNRPDKRNALTKEVVEQLNAAWRAFEAGDDRVAVLTASGDRAFTAGADLEDIPHDLWRAIPGIGVEVTKPVIAAVSGWVVGGGLLFVQYADLAVASTTAKFVYPEAKVGFAGGLIASLAARIPHKAVMELVLLGEPIDANRAYELGLVNKVVPEGQQLQAALDYAAKLADNAPKVLALLKNFIGQTLPKGPSEAAGIARRAVDGVTFSEDIAEGLAAFKAKRPPLFVGR